MLRNRALQQARRAAPHRSSPALPPVHAGADAAPRLHPTTPTDLRGARWRVIHRPHALAKQLLARFAVRHRQHCPPVAGCRQRGLHRRAHVERLGWGGKGEGWTTSKKGAVRGRAVVACGYLFFCFLACGAGHAQMTAVCLTQSIKHSSTTRWRWLASAADTTSTSCPGSVGKRRKALLSSGHLLRRAAHADQRRRGHAVAR